MTDNEQTELGKIAYQAYGDNRDWTTFNGLPMPEWEALGDGIRGGWTAAADAVADNLLGTGVED